jgi:hypothetical protein
VHFRLDYRIRGKKNLIRGCSVALTSCRCPSSVGRSQGSLIGQQADNLEWKSQCGLLIVPDLNLSRQSPRARRLWSLSGRPFHDLEQRLQMPSIRLYHSHVNEWRQDTFPLDRRWLQRRTDSLTKPTTNDKTGEGRAHISELREDCLS